MSHLQFAIEQNDGDFDELIKARGDGTETWPSFFCHQGLYSFQTQCLRQLSNIYCNGNKLHKISKNYSLKFPKSKSLL